jgi:sulfide:quinone oxidoreductase
VKVARLTDDFSVAGQIGEDDLVALAAQGFRTIVNNRPDGEERRQPANAALAAAAQRLGLDYRFIPVITGRIGEGDVAAFEQALATVEGPTLAFCRTGNRCTQLWALAKARQLDTETIVRTVANAGFDVSPLRPHIAARRAS